MRYPIRVFVPETSKQLKTCKAAEELTSLQKDSLLKRFEMCPERATHLVKCIALFEDILQSTESPRAWSLLCAEVPPQHPEELEPPRTYLCYQKGKEHRIIAPEGPILAVREDNYVARPMYYSGGGSIITSKELPRWSEGRARFAHKEEFLHAPLDALRALSWDGAPKEWLQEAIQSAELREKCFASVASLVAMERGKMLTPRSWQRALPTVLSQAQLEELRSTISRQNEHSRPLWEPRFTKLFSKLA